MLLLSHSSLWKWQEYFLLVYGLTFPAHYLDVDLNAHLLNQLFLSPLQSNHQSIYFPFASFIPFYERCYDNFFISSVNNKLFERSGRINKIIPLINSTARLCR